MRKFLCLIAIVCLSFSVFAYDYESSSRRTAMGGCSSSDTSGFINYFNNPAMVSAYGNSDYSLVLSYGISDSLGGDDKAFRSPNSYFKLQFTGDNISIGMSTDYDMSGSDPAKCVKQYQFSVNVSGSFSYFSFGVGAGFVSPWYRTFKVEDTDSFAYILRECYFYPYERVTGEVEADLRAGGLVTYSDFTFGVILNDIVLYENSTTTFSWEQLKKGISFSLAYNPSLYTKRGRLVQFLYSFAFEADHIFDSENGVLMAGNEFCWQLARKHSLSLRLGYNSHLNKLPSGDLTAGLGFRFGDYDIAVDAVIPSDTLAEKGKKDFTLGFTFSALF